MSTRLISGLLFLSVLIFQGCSTLKPYPKQEVENIRISSKVNSGSFFSSVKAEVDIYTLNAQCERDYKGTLSLDNSSLKSGISHNRNTYLSFVFSNSSFLGNSNSSTSFPVYLKAKKGYTYDFIVSYKDNIYNVELFETNPKTKKRKELDTEAKQQCLTR
jgi:hypothetical protein